MTMKDGAGDDPFADEPADTQSMKGTGEIDFDEPTETTEEVPTGRTLVDVLADAFDAIDAGDLRNNIGARDDVAAALGAALEEDDSLRNDLARDLSIALDRDIDADDLDKSHAFRLLFRVGLMNAAPEVFEALQDAKAESAKRTI